MAGLGLRAPVCICSVADPHHIDSDPDPSQYFDADLDPSYHFDTDPDPSHHFDADLDPSYHFNADPDPAFLFDADPNPEFYLMRMRIRILMRIRVPKRMRIHADPDQQHSVYERYRCSVTENWYFKWPQVHVRVPENLRQ